MFSRAGARYRRIAWNSFIGTVRKQSTIVDGPPITETNRAEATMRRFWKQAGVETRSQEGTPGFVVTLDNRPLKTPAGKALHFPLEKRLVATLVATEWENQHTLIKHHALPMTSLASRALDSLSDQATRAKVEESLLEYLDTDTICFQQDYPDPLVNLQQRHWDPLLDWMQKEFNVKVSPYTSILSYSQPTETKEALLKVLRDLNFWEIAAMERATHATKSFIIALALVKHYITVEEASRAARVEVESQIERWGEVEDTHDVDFHEVRRQLGSAAAMLTSM